MAKRLVLISIAVVLAFLPSAARSQAPSGSEFLVNTTTAGEQKSPAVATDANGNFVVVWANGYGVTGQRFNASGTPVGAEFLVNTYTSSYKSVPVVSADPNGNFVVLWNSYGQDGSGPGLFGQRFNATGARLGSEFRVSSYTTGPQSFASVASDAGGNFVVVWQSQDTSTSYGIFGQRFDASGTPQGTEFLVNLLTVGPQVSPSVAADAAGNFVVAWDNVATGGIFSTPNGIFAKRYDAAGTPQAAEFQVNGSTEASVGNPKVASDPNGNFVVVWSAADGGCGFFGCSSGVWGRRFDASGAPQGGEFRINTYTTGNQGPASVSSDEKGNFVVVWPGSGQDEPGFYLLGSGVFGQRYDASGVAQGGEFRVNSYTTGDQRASAVAVSPDGDFVVVWHSRYQVSGYDVFGQRYGDIIFEDGFESGGLTKWSSATTDGGNLSVGGAGAMAGTGQGLQALVNDTSSLFVQDDTPNAENRYNARFYFDPNGFDPGEAQSHFRVRIFIAFDPSGLRVITLVLKRQAGAYSLEARVRRNDGTRADTGFFPIADGPHFFEVDWLRATAPGAGNGSLQLRIDGTPVSTLPGIDNDQSPIDFARMGMLSVKTGAGGTAFYDQFESRRLVVIGPE